MSTSTPILPPSALGPSLIAALASLSAFAAGPTAFAAPSHHYRVVEEKTTVVAGDLERTASTVQVGDDPLDRFQVVHVANSSLPRARGALLLLPPISSGFENYEVDEDGGYDGSFAAYFAERGYDVWGVSQRTHGLVAGTCEGGVDCSTMADWGLQTFLDDAGYVVKQIRRAGRTPGQKPVVGGLSLGSMASMAITSAHPEQFAGILLIEGSVYDGDAARRAITAAYCQQFEGLLAHGIYYDGQQLSGFKMIAQLATLDPTGPTPIPGFPPGFTNHQAFVAFMSNPGPSPLTPYPGYYFLDGNPFTDSYVYANDALARHNVATFSDYVSIRMIRDIECGLAGDRTFTGNLDAYKGPVFVAAGGHGFGPAMLDAVAVMTRADVDLHFDATFGHMDHYFAVHHRDLIEEPILHWLENKVWP